MKRFYSSQWERSYSDFTFDRNSGATAKKALTSALITGSGTAIGLFSGNER